jgi:hypothetical protein
MPSVPFFTSLGTGSLNPNQSATLIWNNAPNDRVILFDAVPFLVNPSNAGAWAQIEITRVWRDITQEPHKQRIQVEFKNTGGVACFFQVFMAQISA